MVKAALHLIEDPATGKMMVPAGVAFADLMAAWRNQHALVDRLFDENDAKGGEWSAEATEHFRQDQHHCHAVEQAIWERPVEYLDDLRMLAELALTYDASDDYAAPLGKAVLAILGPIEAATPPAALFSPARSPRVGLTIGR